MKKKSIAGKWKKILIVDGYNVINVRKPVRESLVLEEARQRLTERLHDYAAWSGQRIIVVYDAWLSDRTSRSIEERGQLQVVFTMKGETADNYIERLCDRMQEDISLHLVEVRVATSDFVEQTVAFGRGAVRVSSRELLNEMDAARTARGPQTGTAGTRHMAVMDRLPQKTREALERMRKGE